MNHHTFAEITTTELDHVTGGGWKSKLVKGAKELAPKIKDKAVEAAKWTGIPAAIGGAAAWVKDKFD